MNARSAKTSKQLSAIVEMLQSRGKDGATSWELADASGSLAIATCVSELRAGGYKIECERVQKPEGRRVYRYRMIA